MAEGSSITSWRDKYLAIRARHAKKIAKVGETTQKVGQAIVAGAAAFAIGVADQKFAAAEPGYTNLQQIKVGPVPLSLLAGAGGLALSVYGDDEKWSGWAEAGALGALGNYSAIAGRRMTIDWQAQRPKTTTAPAA